ncbi:MAG: non-heme iron oxygenase ferredoxin subunit [Microthrixaceae bacterium]|jgi:3-phenylpropionate/trans-cinnamate dioxygenase ferredoxin subunit
MSGLRVCALAELADGEARRVEIGDDDAVALVRIGDDVYAIGDRCSHADVSLSGGEVDERACTLECPKHGSEFDLRTGVPRSLPALRPVPTYDVTVVDGDVFVEIGASS